MSDPLAITDEEAESLARLAQAQLRLATRLSERAFDEPDVDAACQLARASERVARGYRQSLLLKARLGRERNAVEREVALDAARRETRCEELRANLGETLVFVAEPGEREELLEALEHEIAVVVARPDFLEIELNDLMADICTRLPLDEPAADIRAGSSGAERRRPNACDPPPTEPERELPRCESG
jgi:hypothetical protein